MTTTTTNGNNLDITLVSNKLISKNTFSDSKRGALILAKDSGVYHVINNLACEIEDINKVNDSKFINDNIYSLLRRYLLLYILEEKAATQQTNENRAKFGANAKTIKGRLSTIYRDAIIICDKRGNKVCKIDAKNAVVELNNKTFDMSALAEKNLYFVPEKAQLKDAIELMSNKAIKKLCIDITAQYFSLLGLAEKIKQSFDDTLKQDKEMNF